MHKFGAVSILAASALLIAVTPAFGQRRQGRPGQYVKKDLAPVIPGKTPSKQAALAGQKEYRRRGGMCMNSRVYAPAQREARVPKGIGETPVVQPRLRLRDGRLLCYAVAGSTLWAADDQAVYQVDVPSARLVQTFTRSEGLPDAGVQQIAVNADGVWLATFSGLCRLDPASGTIAELSEVRFNVGNLCSGASGTWVVSDSGTYHLPPGGGAWTRAPDFPGQSRLSASVAAGFWLVRWQHGEIDLVSACVAVPSGLCVVHERALHHFSVASGAWARLASGVWQAVARGDKVWALGTEGVLAFDLGSGQRVLHAYGNGPAQGRPVAIAVADDALFLASHGNYEAKAREFKGFSGGGISRLDFATGQWTVTARVGDVNAQFVDSLCTRGSDVWAGVMLYDKPIQRGAHPGMAHVQRWLPHPSGIGLARFAQGTWQILACSGLKTDQRWMGPHGTGVYLDALGPQNVTAMCLVGDRLWGTCRVVPEHWYGGYMLSAGALARRVDGAWQADIRLRTSELGLTGEHPALLGMSRSHGGVYLAEGHARVLGIESVDGRCCVVSQTGVFVHDPGTDEFRCVVREADRVYHRATCAAPTTDSVWFGGDGGTISRLDRRTGMLSLVGVLRGRSIVRITARDDRVVVVSEAGSATLPDTLAKAPALPQADVLVRADGKWAPGEASLADADSDRGSPYACRFLGRHSDEAKRQDNYLDCDGKPVAFLKGVFRPKVLCEDGAGGVLWLSTYGGIASVPLEANPGDGGAR